MIGLIGRKIGMTQYFAEDGGALVPITVIEVLPNTVVKKFSRAGHHHVLLGVLDDKKLSKPRRGQFPKDITPKRVLHEFRNISIPCEESQSIGVDAFQQVNFVDVTGYTKGKGFQGVMRRHGFHGGRKTHGSKFHRGAGSTGMAAFPAKVLKGTKMPGRMGHVKKTVQNLYVMNVLAEQNALLVRGAVPGPNGGIVYVRSAVKKEFSVES